MEAELDRLLLRHSLGDRLSVAELERLADSQQVPEGSEALRAMRALNDKLSSSQRRALRQLPPRENGDRIRSLRAALRQEGRQAITSLGAFALGVFAFCAGSAALAAAIGHPRGRPSWEIWAIFLGFAVVVVAAVGLRSLVLLRGVDPVAREMRAERQRPWHVKVLPFGVVALWLAVRHPHFTGQPVLEVLVWLAIGTAMYVAARRLRHHLRRTRLAASPDLWTWFYAEVDRSDPRSGC